MNCDNKKELVDMVRNSRVVLSTVGPYSVYGSLLVNVCCAYGCDYVDITGEVGWV